MSGAGAGTSSSRPTRPARSAATTTTITAISGTGRGSGRSSATTATRRRSTCAAHAVALPCLMEKWITVRRDSLEIEFRHRLTNLGTRPEPYTWSLHVAHAIGAGLAGLPARHAARASPIPSTSRFGAGCRRGLVADARRRGSAARARPRARADRVAVRDGPAGRARAPSCTRTASGLGPRLRPGASSRTVWTWGVYGGWRGHYVLLTEPSTSPPAVSRQASPPAPPR